MDARCRLTNVAADKHFSDAATPGGSVLAAELGVRQTTGVDTLECRATWNRRPKMPIEITHHADGRYSATVSPPHGGARPWETPSPIAADELIDRLREQGCHQTDIGDAFYAANPNWLEDKGN
jgi:hypothetical protein